MHHFIRLLAVSSILALTCLAMPSFAKDPDEGVYAGDYATIGLGAVVGPSYEGSDEYVVFAVPAVQARLGGLEIQPRAAGLALDFIPDKEGSNIRFQAGPAGRLRFNRNTQIKDPVVKSLGKLDVAVEIGPNVGVTFDKVINPYDSLTFSVDAQWDVGGAHKGATVNPSITYFTPINPGVAIAVTANAGYVDDDFADYYFSIDAEGAAASGLSTFTADSGWKNVSGGLLTVIDFDGDMLNGGIALIVAGNYSRLLGDFKRSPIVSERGSANQWTGAVGLAYTF